MLLVSIDAEGGNYSKEGDCYNREHTWPKSWWGGGVEPQYTDLFHLYPTDGYVNGIRSNWPLGVVATPSYTSTDGAKLGTCKRDISTKCFEPPDVYKGDFSRNYFYVSTAYQGAFKCCTVANAVNGSDILPEMENVRDMISRIASRVRGSAALVCYSLYKSRDFCNLTGAPRLA